MAEEVVETVRYNLRLKRETLFRLTYDVGPGPRPQIQRLFVVRKEQQEPHQLNQTA